MVGILLLLLLAVFLLWFGNFTSQQAVPALVGQVYFDGEYRIGDGEWQTIVEGEHIPSTEGDVTLRGNFHMLDPEGGYVGIYRGDMPIALYTDHISLTIREEGAEPYLLDVENPLYGDSLSFPKTSSVSVLYSNHADVCESRSVRATTER